MLQVGYKTNFSFNEPVSNILNNGMEYEIVSIERLKVIYDNKENPYDTMYKPLRLSLTIFNQDLENNVNIIGIRAVGSSDTAYVPESFISSIPVNNGVPYAEIMVVFSLGLAPIDLDLTILKDTIKSKVQEITNLDVQVLDRRVSSIVIKSVEEDAIYKAKIRYAGNNDKTIYQKYEELQIKYDDLWKMLDSLGGTVQVEILDKTEEV